MLSDRSTATVRATLPAVGAAIGDIADLFYKKLFAAHPELLRDLFNRGNQASGDQRRALASIAAFATALVEHPDTRPDVMLERIAHKHASLGVTPEQYEVVHTHLFAAIADVLGDAVTPEVAEAWDEVYWLMANALIAIEARLYARRGVTAGDVWHTWEVAARIEETEDVATFVLRPADDTCARLPGPVRLRAGGTPGRGPPDTPVQHRGRSLLPAPVDRREARTRSGHSRRRGLPPPARAHPRGQPAARLRPLRGPGARRPGSAPAARLGGHRLHPRGGDARPPRAGGPQGARHRRARRPFASDHALRADHVRLAERLLDAEAHFWYEAPEDGHPENRTGLVDLDGITVRPGTHAYLCGPLPFMRAVRARLLEAGVRPTDIHYEVFGPDLWLASS